MTAASGCSRAEEQRSGLTSLLPALTPGKKDPPQINLHPLAANPSQEQTGYSLSSCKVPKCVTLCNTFLPLVNHSHQKISAGRQNQYLQRPLQLQDRRLAARSPCCPGHGPSLSQLIPQGRGGAAQRTPSPTQPTCIQCLRTPPGHLQHEHLGTNPRACRLFQGR